MLDVFKSDAFSMVSLTDAIIKAPYKPGRIGSLGYFNKRGVATTTVVVEERDGQLSLIATSPRGGSGSTLGASKRKARSFLVPHLERESKVMADEVQGIRAFGSETATESVQAIVAQRLIELRAMHEVTHEHMRAGAIRGKILDADGTTEIFDLFTEFGVTQTTHDINLGTDNVRNECIELTRKIEDVLGAEPITGYRAFCGDEFFDALIADASVVDSLKYQESRLLRTDLRSGFEYGGIVWENYRGKVGSVSFFPTAEAYVVPEGPSIFAHYMAPADFIETVNTLGMELYAKLVDDAELNRWTKVHSQSNPLMLCLRPSAICKVTKS